MLLLPPEEQRGKTCSVPLKWNANKMHPRLNRVSDVVVGRPGDAGGNHPQATALPVLPVATEENPMEVSLKVLTNPSRGWFSWGAGLPYSGSDEDQRPGRYYTGGIGMMQVLVLV